MKRPEGKYKTHLLQTHTDQKLRLILYHKTQLLKRPCLLENSESPLRTPEGASFEITCLRLPSTRADLASYDWQGWFQTKHKSQQRSFSNRNQPELQSTQAGDTRLSLPSVPFLLLQIKLIPHAHSQKHHTKKIRVQCSVHSTARDTEKNKINLSPYRIWIWDGAR